MEGRTRSPSTSAPSAGWSRMAPHGRRPRSPPKSQREPRSSAGP